jgi:hypothetical protein
VASLAGSFEGTAMTFLIRGFAILSFADIGTLRYEMAEKMRPATWFRELFI